MVRDDPTFPLSPEERESVPEFPQPEWFNVSCGGAVVHPSPIVYLDCYRVPPFYRGWLRRFLTGDPARARCRVCGAEMEPATPDWRKR